MSLLILDYATNEASIPSTGLDTPSLLAEVAARLSICVGVDLERSRGDDSPLPRPFSNMLGVSEGILGITCITVMRGSSVSAKSRNRATLYIHQSQPLGARQSEMFLTEKSLIDFSLRDWTSSKLSLLDSVFNRIPPKILERVLPTVLGGVVFGRNDLDNPLEPPIAVLHPQPSAIRISSGALQSDVRHLKKRLLNTVCNLPAELPSYQRPLYGVVAPAADPVSLSASRASIVIGHLTGWSLLIAISLRL